MTRACLIREAQRTALAWCILTSIGDTIGGVIGRLTWPKK